MAKCKSLKIGQGTTYTQVYTYGIQPLVYKPIAAKVSDTPLTLAVTAHGAPSRWPVALTDIGYDGVDADDWPPDGDDFLDATATGVDTLVFNAVDLARLSGTYASGGSIAYLTPVDLTACSASFKLYDSSGVLALSVAAVLDNTAKTITVTLTAVQTAALTAGQYTYALLFTDSGGAITELDDGYVNIFVPGVDVCQ